MKEIYIKIPYEDLKLGKKGILTFPLESEEQKRKLSKIKKVKFHRNTELVSAQINAMCDKWRNLL